jgi:hypothetical protein
MYKEVKIYTTGSQTVRRAPHGGAVSPLGGAPVVCVRDKFILNEIWTQDYIYIYILIGTLLEVIFLSQLVFFSYYYADERNYYTLCFMFICRTNILHHFLSAL